MKGSCEASQQIVEPVVGPGSGFGFGESDLGPNEAAPLGYVPYLTVGLEVDVEDGLFSTVPEYDTPSKADWNQNAFYWQSLTITDPKRFRAGPGSVRTSSAKMKLYAHAVEFVPDRIHFNRKSKVSIRGEIPNWSKRSRSRLLRCLSKIQTSK